MRAGAHAKIMPLPEADLFAYSVHHENSSADAAHRLGHPLIALIHNLIASVAAAINRLAPAWRLS
jgi:hypothetical protein